MRALLAFALLLGAVSPVASQANPLLVEPGWVADNLNSPNLVLIHIGDGDDYQQEHLPGAQLLDLSQIITPHDHSRMSTELMTELLTPAETRAVFEKIGVSDNSRIVVYYADDWVTQSTRVIFTLDWLGLGQQTSLLNGGMRAYKAAGHAVTARRTNPAVGKLSSRPVRDIVVDAEFVRSIADDDAFQLVDGRAPAVYRGLTQDMGKAGHIPGAVNVSGMGIADDQLTFDMDRIRAMFDEAGVEPGQTVVAYCHVGHYATATIFAARLLGHSVRLYDGSFQDWAYNDRGPVVR